MIVPPQIYLDFNATTPCDPTVVEAMLPYFETGFGNPSSSHHPYGWLAKEALEEAYQLISNVLNINSNEVFFSSGSTESINTILKGVFEAEQSGKNHIVTAKTEHKAVLDVCSYLEEKGAQIIYLDVDANGLIDLNQLDACLSDRTLLVALMLANNETGVIQDLEATAKLCQKYGSLFFSDATQALGKIELGNFFEYVDFACFSGHKIYGPKGVGFTFCKAEHRSKITPFIHGGGQQGGFRGGTFNVAGIVGLAQSIKVVQARQAEEKNRLQPLRDSLEKGLLSIEKVQVNGFGTKRLPNTLNVTFDYVDGESLLRALSRFIAVSNGSACNSASVNPSHVLTAMGRSKSQAFASVRFSLGTKTTLEDIEKTIEIVRLEIANQRASNVLWERRNE